MTRAERIEKALRTLHRTVRGYEAESFGHDALDAAMADAESAYSAPEDAPEQAPWRPRGDIWAPAPASPRPEEPGAQRCGGCEKWRGPSLCDEGLGITKDGDLVCSGFKPRAQPEAPRCGGCGYLPSFDSVEQGVYAPSGEPCPGCPDCAGRSSQPEVKP